MIEHSENNIIRQSGLFENETGPGVLHSSVQKTRVLEVYKGTNQVKLIMCPLSVLYEISADVCLLNGGLEHSCTSSTYVIILFSKCSIGNMNFDNNEQIMLLEF